MMKFRISLVFIALIFLAQGVIPVQAKGDIKTIIQQLRHGEPKEKIKAAKALAQYKDNSQTVEALIAAIDDTDIQVRKTVVKVLGDIGAKQAMPRLVQSLSDEDYLWEEPLKAIAKIQDPSSYEILLNQYNKSTDFNRHVAIEALGLFGDARAMNVFESALTSENVYERKQAARALGRIDVPDAVSPLLKALKDTEKGVREDAVYGLSSYWAEEPAVDALIMILDDDEASVRTAAANGLGKKELSRSADVLEALVKAGQDSSAAVRAAAAQSLRFFNDPQAIELLLALLADENGNVKMRAHFALKEITGQSLGADPQLWQAWWQKKK